MMHQTVAWQLVQLKHPISPLPIEIHYRLLKEYMGCFTRPDKTNAFQVFNKHF